MPVLFGFLDFFSTMFLIFALVGYGLIRMGKAAVKNPENTASAVKLMQLFLKR